MIRDNDTKDRRGAPQLRAVQTGAGESVDGSKDAMPDARLAELVAYWQSMRSGTNVPRRSEVDPRRIEPLLSNAFIAERIAPGIARMRIAGSHLADLMGMEVRGMPISAFISTSDRDALANHLVCLFDQPAIVNLTLAAKGRPGAPALTGQMLIMPLRSDFGDISRALGCLVTRGNIGIGARRFDIVDARITPLEGAAELRRPHDPGKPRVVATDERIPPAARRQGERSYLRLIKG